MNNSLYVTMFKKKTIAIKKKKIYFKTFGFEKEKIENND